MHAIFRLQVLCRMKWLTLPSPSPPKCHNDIILEVPPNTNTSVQVLPDAAISYGYCQQVYSMLAFSMYITDLKAHRKEQGSY